MENWLLEMEIYANRHAYSGGQENPDMYNTFGDSKVPLSDPIGFQQGEAMGRAYNELFFLLSPPKSDIAVLSSPYLRSDQTWNTASPHITYAKIACVIYCDYLGEQRFGNINGMDQGKVTVLHPHFLIQQAEAERKGERYRLAFPGVDVEGIPGESQYDVYMRTKRIKDELKKLYDAGFRTVIMNSHGTSERLALMHILEIHLNDSTFKNWKKPRNCQIDRIANGQWTQAIFPGFEEPTRHSPHSTAALHLTRPGNGTS